MIKDDDINRAVEAGKKNQATIGLVRNWCRHAGIRKMGGVGIIEQQTGLPIGHHAMACEFAANPGMGTWDLTESVLDFYDRNCAPCVKREPVGFPNISTLIDRRDAAVASSRKQDVQLAAEAAARRAQRQEVRAALRSQLDPLSAPLIDAIAELDSSGPRKDALTLLEAARLAPETFTPSIIEYCFDLLEQRQSWFYETGLNLLFKLGVDPERLVRNAATGLQHYEGVLPGSAIIEAHAGLLDANQVQAMLPALAALANPPHTPFGRGADPIKGPFLALYRAQKTAVESALHKHLDSRDPPTVGAAARAICLLAQEGGLRAANYARGLAAKLIRAGLLLDIDPTSYTDKEVFNELEAAVTAALEDDPIAVDQLLAGFVAGAPVEGEIRVYAAYGACIKRITSDGGRRIEPAVAETVLARILKVVEDTESHEVLRAAQNAVSYVSEDLYPVLRSKLATLLGTVLFLQPKVEAKESEITADKPFFERLEIKNHAEMLEGIQVILLKAAAEAASGEMAATRQYIEVLNGLPESSDRLAGKFLEHSTALMHTPRGLNVMLPTIYASLVGVSFYRRRAAAIALGNIEYRRRDDLPSLVYEALMPLLTDPIKAIHQAAFETLQKLKLPADRLNEYVSTLYALILAYKDDRKSDGFFLDAIRAFRAETKSLTEDLRRRHDELFFALIEKVGDQALLRNIRWITAAFSHQPRFANLVLRLLQSDEKSEHEDKDLVDALNRVPDELLKTHSAQLEELGVSPVASQSLSASLVETLTRLGSWEEGARINDALFAQIPDTVELRKARATINLHRIATRFEAAIARGDRSSLRTLAEEWRAAELILEEGKRG